tara:strand:+ start:19873 stop:21057 length:1185 start_codon:yes stop_codon:yes gene_type:complete
MGDVILNQPRAFSFFTVGAALVVCVLGAILCMSEYSRKSTVPGYLAPAAGIASIYATRGGMVTTIFVADGDFVQAGEDLLRLSLDTTNQTAPTSTTAQMARLQERVEEAELQLLSRATLLQGESEHWQHTISDLEIEIASLIGEETLAAERVTIAEQQIERWQILSDQGLAPRVAMDARRLEWITAQADLRRVRRGIRNLRTQIQEAEDSLELFPAHRDLELSQIRSTILDLEQSKQSLSRMVGYVLTAPISGQISSTQVTEGMTVIDSRPLMAVIPQSSELIAHLYVPTSAAGFIEPGQVVRLRVEAFPFQRFGTIAGRVTQISTDALEPFETVSAPAGGSPVYLVKVQLEDQYISADGGVRALQSGMALSADIIVDQRPVWRWLFEPILSNQ